MADCNKTVDFIKEKARLCNSYECSRCPLSYRNNESGKECEYFIIDYTDEAIAMVQLWSDEHPEPKGKTYLEDFFEKFPNTKTYSDGTPMLCRATIYGGSILEQKCRENKCSECWNEVVEE